MPIASLPGNLEMHYYDDDFTDPWKSSAETVLLHHGNSRNGRLWFGWVPALARDYRVIRVDARGFGDSSVPPPGYPWSLDGFVQDACNLLDHLGIRKVHWVGEAYGCNIGLKFCHAHPERALTYTGCEPGMSAGGVLRYLPMIKEQGVEHWARSSQFFETPEHTDWHARQMGKTNLRVTLETVQAASSTDLRPLLPTMRTPTLVLLGAGTRPDPKVATMAGHGNVINERAEELAALLPNARVVRIPGNNGRPHFSKPDECARRWRAFADEVREAVKQ